MRAWGLMCTQMKRQRLKMLVFVLCVLAISLYSVFTLLPVTQTLSLEGEPGASHLVQTNAGLKLYDQPVGLTSPTIFSAFVALSALWMVRRERKFEVSLSVARYEMLLGSFFYILAASLTMTLAYQLVSIAGRGVLWGGGFRLRNGWNVNVLLTGGDKAWFANLVAECAGMVQTACVYTLLGYIFARWWRPLFILGGVGIAFMILFFTQISTVRLIVILRQWLAEALTWVFDTALPAFLEYLEHSAPYEAAARRLGVAVVCMLLSYPVIRRMPVTQR